MSGSILRDHHKRIRGQIQMESEGESALTKKCKKRKPQPMKGKRMIPQKGSMRQANRISGLCFGENDFQRAVKGR
jgi:hypothetical protein